MNVPPKNAPPIPIKNMNNSPVPPQMNMMGMEGSPFPLPRLSERVVPPTVPPTVSPTVSPTAQVSQSDIVGFNLSGVGSGPMFMPLTGSDLDPAPFPSN